MNPTMRYICIVWGKKTSQIQAEDIVAYSRSKYKKMIHRVKYISSDGIAFIKGDNAPEIDYIPVKEILFKITGFKNIIW